MGQVAESGSRLWASLSSLQKELEGIYRSAAKNRSLTDFGPMSPLLRTMHWAAAFLGLCRWADIAAGGSALVAQLQDPKYRWSPEYARAIANLLKRTAAFCKARAEPPPPGVFVDSEKAVLQGPELKQPVPVDDLLSLFRRRQISIERVSACRELSTGRDETFSHSITIPSSAKHRHRKDRNLSLLYLDLDEQNLSFADLTSILEDCFRRSEILLHGPLAIPLRKFVGSREKRPYYVLLDSPGGADQWLEAAGLSGRVVKVLMSAETAVGDLTAHSSREPANSARPDRDLIQMSNSTPPVETSESPVREPADGESSRSIAGRKRRIRNRDLNVRFSVGMKLMIIVSAIVVISMSSLSVVGLFFFRSEIKNRVEETNISLSATVAKQAESEILQIFNSANLLFQVGSAAEGSQTELVDAFFANSRSVIYVGVPGTEYNFSNRAWFEDNGLPDEAAAVAEIMDVRGDDLARARNGEAVIINVSPLVPNLKSPLLALAAPLLLGEAQEALVVLADIGDGLAESVRLQEGFITTVIINSDGEVLAHPDFSRIFDGETLRESPVFAQMYSQGGNRGQIRFEARTDDGSAAALGSFSLIPVGGLGVVSTVLERDAFAVVNRVQVLNLTMLGAILSLAILAVFFFSQSMSTPLKELTVATRQIKTRNYDISIKPRSSDEVGQLTQDFISMIPELEKVDRLQERTSKFVNPQVARMIAENSLPDSAETKDVTVFFSDIRGFTAMSEAMGNPQYVLDNLTEYFQSMVLCIQETDGTVDKFIGDAVMAVWGSMKDLPNNAENAVSGALKMRDALRTFNVNRGSTRKPVFQIGCGLNTGPVTVGLMGGGSAKEEWAHMGDTVNLASRIEALNKPMGTDILISQAVSDRVQGIFDLVPMKKISVKGKSEPQQIYAVLGHLDDETRPRSLAELRAALGITGDFSKAAEADEDEAKYKILDS